LAVQLACLIAGHGTGERAQVNVPEPGDWTGLSPRGTSEDRQEFAHTRLKTMRPSAADLMFLRHLQQTQLGTSNRKAALES
jgi:hypothetical protein